MSILFDTSTIVHTILAQAHLPQPITLITENRCHISPPQKSAAYIQMARTQILKPTSAMKNGIQHYWLSLL